MHATYILKIPIDMNDDQYIVTQARVAAENYAETYCDENNWWSAMALVTWDNKVYQMAEAGDYRGRDEYAKELEEEAQGNPIAYTLDYARKIWLYEVRFAIEAVTKKYHETPEVTWATASSMMRSTLANYALTGEPWALNHLTKILYRFDGVKEDDPFYGEPASPYEDVRTMDLVPYKDNRKVAYLYLDIHT